MITFSFLRVINFSSQRWLRYQKRIPIDVIQEVNVYLRSLLRNDYIQFFDCDDFFCDSDDFFLSSKLRLQKRIPIEVIEITLTQDIISPASNAVVHGSSPDMETSNLALVVLVYGGKYSV